MQKEGQCSECGWDRTWGCRFDCPLHMPPADPRNYRVWADIQKEGYRSLGENAASRLAEERREKNWQARHPDVPYQDRYRYIENQEREVMKALEEAADRIVELEQQEDIATTALAFEMGDVVLSVCPPGEHGINTGRLSRLGELVSERGGRTGIETLRSRAWVSATVQDVIRITSVPWGVYQALAGEPSPEKLQELLETVSKPNPNRPDGRWTVNAARALRGLKPAGNPERGSVEHMAPEEKVEQFRQLAAEPEVTQTALRNPETRTQVREAALLADAEQYAAEAHEPDEPTVSMGEVLRREREAVASDLPLQFDRVLEQINRFAVQNTAEDVASVLVQRRDLDYLKMCGDITDSVTTWLTALRNELRRQSSPRLVREGVA